MAASIEEIMDAVEVRLKTIPGLRTDDIAAGQQNVSGNASVATVAVPPIPAYRSTMGRGSYELLLDVYVNVSPTPTRVGQRKLAAFASQTGDKSIRAAVEADRTLGGTVQDCIVRSFEPLGLEQVGALGYFGGVFSLYVIASGV